MRQAFNDISKGCVQWKHNCLCSRNYIPKYICHDGFYGCMQKISNGAAMSDEKLKSMRLKMVETQIVSRGVKEKKVLDSMNEVPRHKFIDSDLLDQAYADYPLPIGEGQTISQPYIVALMTELLELKGDERVLEVGTGSGYQTAVLGEIAKEVYSIEIIDSLASKASVLLREMGYKNVLVKTGDGYGGWPEKAPFDRVVITAAPDKIPEPLLSQLKDGGLLVAPVGSVYQELIVSEKKGKQYERRGGIPVRFVPMTGKTEKGGI